MKSNTSPRVANFLPASIFLFIIGWGGLIAPHHFIPTDRWTTLVVLLLVCPGDHRNCTTDHSLPQPPFPEHAPTYLLRCRQASALVCSVHLYPGLAADGAGA